jgi:hypothetical protein
MNRGRVGEERGSKETDGCPLQVVASAGPGCGCVRSRWVDGVWLVVVQARVCGAGLS